MEDCLVLDMNKLVRDGVVIEGQKAGTLLWKSIYTGEEKACIRYDLELIEPCNLRFYLMYTITAGRNEGEFAVKETIQFTTTRPNFGGKRWWFICPLIVNEFACGRRIGKLYLPPGEKYFGCRSCHDLTYESCRESHKYDRIYRLIASDTGISVDGVKESLKR